MNNYRLFIILTLCILAFVITRYDNHKTTIDYVPHIEGPTNPIETIRPSFPADSEPTAESITEGDQGSSTLDDGSYMVSEAPIESEYDTQHESATQEWPICWRPVQLEKWEIDFFAKLLYCEAGGMGYEGQLWVASAILNLSEVKQMSIWEMGHQVNIFSVAPYVDDATPLQTQYDIIYDILVNGWIADVCYFRTDYPHSFGTFMKQVENVYFNCQ